MDQFRDKAHLAGEGDSGSVSSAASGEEKAGFLYDSRRGELLGRASNEPSRRFHNHEESPL